MSELLLSIPNCHTAAAGPPPQIHADVQKNYIGYFENPYGEQWVFEFNLETKKAVLRGGELGWNEVLPVVGGTVDDLIMNPAEQAWLQLCWQAATGSSEMSNFLAGDRDGVPC